MTSIERQIKSHVRSIRPTHLDQWATSFATNDLAIMSGVLPRTVEDEFVAEARRLIDEAGQRRETTIAESGNTPRAYDSVGRDTIRARGSRIPAVFDSAAFVDFLSSVAGERLHPVPYAPEEFIINRQSRPKDTHGWHWDDYAYALIWCIDEPDPRAGGRVEYIPHIDWDKDDTSSYLDDILSSKEVRSIHVRSGECYLMKANTSLHRIAPLTAETQRTVVVMTFASTADLTDANITHGSMEEIYAPEVRQSTRTEAA